jgi:hypothetical protein
MRQSKINAVKKLQQILQYKRKIPSNIAQTWTIGEETKTNFTRTLDGD